MSYQDYRKESAGIHGGLVDLSGDNPSKNGIVYSSVFIGGGPDLKAYRLYIKGKKEMTAT